MPYSFPVSPSVLFGAPCRVNLTRHGILHCVQNNKKTAMCKLSCSKPQKNEDDND